MNTDKHEHDSADPSCLEVFERLSEYLNGELSAKDCEEIQEHIRDCEPCVAFVESLKTSIRATHELRAHEPVRELPEAIREKLKAAWKAALQRRAG